MRAAVPLADNDSSLSPSEDRYSTMAPSLKLLKSLDGFILSCESSEGNSIRRRSSVPSWKPMYTV
jgi:hypothetical protein